MIVRRIIFFTLVLSLCPFPALAGQPLAPSDSDTLWKSSGQYDQMACDPNGNFYLVKGPTLIKFSPSGDSLYSWSDPESGRISRVDAQNPFRIMVYHSDFNRIRLLNNRLAPLSPPTEVDELGIPNPLALCSSRQGGIWIFDGNELTIKYFDPLYQQALTSAPCSLGTQPTRGQMSLLERADRLYLHIPDQEILVFDLFGNLIRKLSLRAASLDVFESKLVMASDNRVILWKDAVTPALTLAEMSTQPVLQSLKCRNNLLIRLADRVLLLRAK